MACADGQVFNWLTLRCEDISTSDATAAIASGEADSSSPDDDKIITYDGNQGTIKEVVVTAKRTVAKATTAAKSNKTTTYIIVAILLLIIAAVLYFKFIKNK